jgi:type I restriction enzyme S subunit
MEVPVFPVSQKTIARRLETLLVRQALLAEESKVLAALRDVLLPQLISGKLRLKDPKRLVEGMAS